VTSRNPVAAAIAIAIPSLVGVACSADETPGGGHDASEDASLDGAFDAPSEAGCQCTAKPALACLCGYLQCPPTLDEATDCSKVYAVSKRKGCGYTLVQIGYQKAGYGYGIVAYDSKTREIVGVKTQQETPFGPCASTTYTSELFPSDCSFEPECGLCGKKGETGDAGPC